MFTYDEIIVTALFFSLVVFEYFFGTYRRSKRIEKDWLIDSISFIQLSVQKPLVMFAAFALGTYFLPEMRDSLVNTPYWLAFLIVFIPDDFFHYWIHRFAHVMPWLWPTHRTHHTATSYQASNGFRENWLWFTIMPGFWWQGLMIYFGLIEEVLLSTAIIGVHNVWLHNGSTKDTVLYKNRFTKLPMKIFEFFINTPSLHRAHHGLGKNSVPYGNYAQTLFVWDVLFGTATFTKDAVPEYYAVSNDEIMQQPWYYHLWWPLVKKRPVPVSRSEMEESETVFSAN